MIQAIENIIAFIESFKSSMIPLKVKDSTTTTLTFNSDWDFETNGCPDCHIKPFAFLSGPCGGASENICCANPTCRSAFNFCPGFFCERISNAYFRKSFPEFPFESEGYEQEQIRKQLVAETDKLLEEYKG